MPCTPPAIHQHWKPHPRRAPVGKGGAYIRIYKCPDGRILICVGKSGNFCMRMATHDRLIRNGEEPCKHYERV